METVIVTSEKSASLNKVSKDLARVLESEGIAVKDFIYSPNVDPSLYDNLDAVIIVMTFDPYWAKPYFYLCWSRLSYYQDCLFYTTIEGDPIKILSDKWIYRDLEFIANSKYTARKLAKAGARIKDIVYHGIFVDDVQKAKPLAKRMRNIVGVKDDDFMVLYIAGAYMRKGHEYLAEVARYVGTKDPSIKFVVFTQPKSATAYSGLTNVRVVTDFGNLDEDEIYALYHATDLYVQASLSEGFGLPVLEALAAGKPVVHADYEPLSEITTPKTSFRVKVIGLKRKRESGGILYELNLYDPVEMANTILYAKDEVIKNRDEYMARCIERAKEFEASKVYKAFADMLK